MSYRDLYLALLQKKSLASGDPMVVRVVVLQRFFSAESHSIFSIGVAVALADAVVFVLKHGVIPMEGLDYIRGCLGAPNSEREYLMVEIGRHFERLANEQKANGFLCDLLARCILSIVERRQLDSSFYPLLERKLIAVQKEIDCL